MNSYQSIKRATTLSAILLLTLIHSGKGDVIKWIGTAKKFHNSIFGSITAVPYGALNSYTRHYSYWYGQAGGSVYEQIQYSTATSDHRYTTISSHSSGYSNTHHEVIVLKSASRSRYDCFMYYAPNVFLEEELVNFDVRFWIGNIKTSGLIPPKGPLNVKCFSSGGYVPVTCFDFYTDNRIFRTVVDVPLTASVTSLVARPQYEIFFPLQVTFDELRF